MSISAGPGQTEQNGYEEAKRQVTQTETEAGREAGASHKKELSVPKPPGALASHSKYVTNKVDGGAVTWDRSSGRRKRFKEAR